MAKQTGNKPVLTEDANEEEHKPFAVFFKIGEWRHRFTEYQYKTVIAVALNNCIQHRALRLVGYIISETDLVMVLHVNKKYINKFLGFFFEEVRNEISKHASETESFDIGGYNNDDQVRYLYNLSTLFKKYNIHNDYLERLITGRRVELRYDDPHLVRLKQVVNKADFCSAIDYSGGIGPVRVRLWYDNNVGELQ